MTVLNPSEKLRIDSMERLPTFPSYPCNYPSAPHPLSRTGQAIVIPYWVQQAITRHKLVAADILDYVKLRSILSVTDMARFIGLNQMSLSRYLPSFGYGRFYVLLGIWEQSGLSTELKSELTNIIMPLSDTDAVKAELQDQLSVPVNEFDLTSAVVQGYYQVQIGKNELVFVFVQRGILNALEVRDNAKAFVSDYLRAQYSLISIREVSQDMAFRDYLDLL